MSRFGSKYKIFVMSCPGLSGPKSFRSGAPQTFGTIVRRAMSTNEKIVQKFEEAGRHILIKVRAL
jgi:hypothetical protein